MPNYEYRCAKCGVFEIHQSIKADSLEKCPECGSDVKRLISRNIGIVYKAGGFYTTDNRPSTEKEKVVDKGSEATADKTAEASA